MSKDGLEEIESGKAIEAKADDSEPDDDVSHVGVCTLRKIDGKVLVHETH